MLNGGAPFVALPTSGEHGLVLLAVRPLPDFEAIRTLVEEHGGGGRAAVVAAVEEWKRQRRVALREGMRNLPPREHGEGVAAQPPALQPNVRLDAAASSTRPRAPSPPPSTGGAAPVVAAAASACVVPAPPPPPSGTGAAALPPLDDEAMGAAITADAKRGELSAYFCVDMFYFPENLDVAWGVAPPAQTNKRTQSPLEVTHKKALAKMCVCGARSAANPSRTSRERIAVGVVLS